MNFLKYLSKRIILIEGLFAIVLFSIIYSFLEIELIDAIIEIGYLLIGLLGLYFFVKLKMFVSLIGWSVVYLSFIIDFIDEFENYFELPEYMGNFDDLFFLVGILIMVFGLYKEILRDEEEIERLEGISYIDNLTKAFNRNYIHKFKNELSKTDYPVGIIMADINGLKFVNDSYGHDSGDALLKNAAILLNNIANNENDVLVRIGGDEFLILLKNTSQENIDQMIKSIMFESRKKSFIEIPVSFAIGYAIQMTHEDDFERILRLADDRMYLDKMLNRKSLGNNYMNALKKTLEEKSYETSLHEERMVEIARIIGQYLNINRETMDALELATSLHDIGKIAVPETIILKNGDLDDSEWENIRRHPEVGSRIINGIFTLPLVEQGILSHHERWDGKGYPSGLSGIEIPLISRIINIIDSFDVMLQGRVYQESKSVEEALQELYDCAGTQFDPELVSAFIEIYESNYLNIQNFINEQYYNEFEAIEL